MAKKLLICDDDQDIVEMLELILEGNGFEIITETDSNKVYGLILDLVPDALLMDLWMPVINGDEILRLLRENISTSKLPVIIMSAAQDGESIAQDAGADEFISKPFDVDELIAMVQQMLRKSS